jgi:hypothetical protein
MFSTDYNYTENIGTLYNDTQQTIICIMALNNDSQNKDTCKTGHNDTEYNDTMYNDTEYNETLYNDTRHTTI